MKQELFWSYELMSKLDCRKKSIMAYRVLVEWVLSQMCIATVCFRYAMFGSRESGSDENGTVLVIHLINTKLPEALFFLSYAYFISILFLYLAGSVFVFSLPCAVCLGTFQTILVNDYIKTISDFVVAGQELHLPYQEPYQRQMHEKLTYAAKHLGNCGM